MQHKLPLPVRVALAVIIVGALAYLGYNTLNDSTSERIAASGSIEATIINVSPELAGKVTDVLAEEGQAVKANDALLSLDSTLLNAQRTVAAAQVNSAKTALSAAQNKLEQTLQSVLVAEGKQPADWRFSAPDEFKQPLWYFHDAEQMYAMESEAEKARNAYNDSLASLAIVIKDLDNQEFVQAEESLIAARTAFLVAKDVKIQAENASQSGGLLSAAYDYYNAAVDELESAQIAYDKLLDSTAAKNILNARAQVALMQQQYNVANAHLVALQTGWNSPAVINASDARAQAEKNLEQAEANLAMIDAQLAKLNIASPLDGVILTRNVEPGEFIQPGAVALTMADLSAITITVYVPENLYGKISLGQQAEVRVDSFPDLTFTGIVIQISDQAEFTPRNVQTVEGRSATFYAIKLQIDNPEGKLKIGMPADVAFE